jgi:hypothetical protein
VILSAKHIVALGAAALVACGLTADFSGLQGGVRDAGLVDASLPPADASQLDGSTTPDSMSDVIISDEVSTGFCESISPPPKLCADFDEGEPVGTGWTLFDTTQGQTVSVDTTTSVSPPGSFLSLIEGNDGTPESARVAESLPVLSNHVHAAFDLLYMGGEGPFEIFAVHELTTDGNTYGLFYKVQGGQLLVYIVARLEDGGLVQNVYPLGAPPSTWVSVDIEMDIADSADVVVTQDGAVVVNAIGIDTSTDDRSQLFVEVGFYSPNAASAQANIDNVVVDWP